MLVDTHIHLDVKYEDVYSVIAAARLAGVSKIIQVSTDEKSMKQSLEFASKFDIVSCGLGLYPDTIVELAESEIIRLLDFIESRADKIICISEIGLDRKHTSDEKLIEKQKKWFKVQLELAKKLDLPVQIHSRDAELECIEILEELEMKRVQMHCFAGGSELIRRSVKNGWYFSVPVKAVKNNQFQELIRYVPLSKMLTETDGPYLHPDYGTLNEPKFVRLTIEKIAEIKEISTEEVEKLVFQNFKRLYG